MSQRSTVENRPTATIEDYLAIMFIMERDGEEIIAARLAESLDVSAPTVAMTLKRMKRDGWIEYDGPKDIHLTELGCQAASSVIRRHMLTEWMLARMLKVSWSDVHSEAHAIEHDISQEIENRIKQNFDDPRVCPHGNPLPGYEYISADWKSLVEMQAGDRVVIRRIHELAENDADLLQYLERNGVIPGVTTLISEILPFNRTLTLDLDGHKVILGFPAAQNIYVEKV